MPLLINIFALTALGVVASIFGSVGYAFGKVAMFFFMAGWVCSTVVWQIAHKGRYGSWFEPPVVNADTNPPTIEASSAGMNRSGRP